MKTNIKINTVALILSAGRGTRFDQSILKQYTNIGEEVVLAKSLAVFSSHPLIDAIKVVIHPEHLDSYEKVVTEFDLLPPVYGGKIRQESALAGLESLVDIAPTNVLIHDAARPFVDPTTIDNVVNSVMEGNCCVPVIPVTDTLKEISKHRVIRTLDRSIIFSIQTPQGFPFNDILAAHRAFVGQSFTDDAAIVEAYGLTVNTVKGSRKNFKITEKSDLERIEENPNNQIPDIRVGNGFDVHRFGNGDHVIICGIKIPYSSGLEGHSDADVGYHALTDSLLGAIGKGDIGEHFPPNDETWKDVNSQIFLEFAMKSLKSLNGKILNLDLTIICQEPKINNYRNDMRNKLADVLSIENSRINIKATTTENLGFLGRKEGISAQATATVLIKTYKD